MHTTAQSLEAKSTPRVDPPQISPVHHKLRDLCIEILEERIGSSAFDKLLIETGVNLTSWEWDVIQRLIDRSGAATNTAAFRSRARH